MPCSCGLSHCPECMGGNWTPPEPPEHGSCGWKDDMASSYASNNKLWGKTQIVKLPTVEGVDLGYLAIRYYPNSGTDYFRVDNITAHKE